MKLQIIKEERSTLGIKVRALAKELSNIDDRHVFISNFSNELKKIKTGNHSCAELQYRVCIDPKGGNVEIWHKHSTKPDVLVMQLYNY